MAITVIEFDLEKVEKAVDGVDAERVESSYDKIHALGVTDREIVEAAMGIVGVVGASIVDGLRFRESDAASLLLTSYVLTGITELADENGQVIQDTVEDEEEQKEE